MSSTSVWVDFELLGELEMYVEFDGPCDDEGITLTKATHPLFVEGALWDLIQARDELSDLLADGCWSAINEAQCALEAIKEDKARAVWEEHRKTA